MRLPQVAAGFAGFLGLRGLVLAGFFRAAAGPIAIGRPAGAAVASSGSGRKCARQPGESWDFFRIMQAVMRSTSGTNSPHSCIASPVQACCCSGE